jgi:L-threonylcarbamoyladenylate synthase
MGFLENHQRMDVEQAAEILKSGGLVAFPTESFYGLAADAANEAAIEKLFFVKRRKPGNPVLLLIPAIEQVTRYAAHVSKTAKKIMNAFWPGGLTLVFQAQENVSALLTAETGKIGIRVSSHPLARSLPQTLGGAITGTSANISGTPPCRRADEVLTALGAGVDKILDGGETAGQKPSTVLDVTVWPHAILREGLISKELLQPYLEAFH